MGGGGGASCVCEWRGDHVTVLFWPILRDQDGLCSSSGLAGRHGLALTVVFLSFIILLGFVPSSFAVVIVAAVAATAVVKIVVEDFFLLLLPEGIAMRKQKQKAETKTLSAVSS